ncbi:MAG: M48 family metalloprotease [Bacteroidales bacterium]
MKKISSNRFPVLLIVLLILPGCAKNPVTGNRQLMLVSERREIQMGEEYDPQVISVFGEYENEPLLAFIEEQGTEMGKISHRPDLEYHFRILDTHVVNAFAVPGGYIYLTRGILAHFNNEAELIGVLGHEMGHITARHSVSRQSQKQLAQLLLVGGMIAFEEFREYGAYAMEGMQLLFLKYSRDDERESDVLGVEYASKIGYDSEEFAAFFSLLESMEMASEQGGVPTLLSTHPDPGDRYNTVTRMAREWKDSVDRQDWQVNRNNYLEMIDGMVYGEDPRQGYVEGNTFYHPELEFFFSFPADWKLENSPLQVTISPEEGEALMLFALAEGSSLEEAARNTLKRLDLTVEESSATTVNGLPVFVARSTQVSQNQQTGEEQTISVLSYFYDDDDTYYAFHGLSLQADSDRYLQRFEETMKGFSKLTDRDKIEVTPRRIRIREVAHDGTLAEALRHLGIKEADMQEYAFLNNMGLDEKVEAGDVIKIVADDAR